jgi:hypothetical protein
MIGETGHLNHTCGKHNTENRDIRVCRDNINNVKLVTAEEDEQKQGIENDREDEVAESDIEKRTNAMNDGS